MELVTIVDEQKNKYTFKRYKGFAFNKEFIGNVKDQLDKIAHRTMHDDDVLLCVYPKSGIHWLYNTVMMLRTGSLKYTGSPTWMEFQDFDLVEKMESPRTFGSHLRFQFLPEQMKQGKGKVITILRNPKDIVVSMYKMMQVMGDIGYQGTFEGLLRIFLSDEYFFGLWVSWVKEVEKWEKPNCLALSFEDLKKNTFANVVKLAKFLEVDHGEDFLQSVAQSIQFDKLKESHNHSTPITDRWREITEDGRLPIYRRGQVGEWKNVFTVAQSEEFDRVFKAKVAEFGLKTDVSFD